MIRITKAEAMELNKRGIPWHENGICRTYSARHHYYLSETRRNLNMLENLRSEKVVVS